jgi:hypothetical protein
MAPKSKNLLVALSNAKTRTYVLLFGIIIIIGIAIAFLNRGNNTSSALSQQGSQATTVPSRISSTPGNIVSPQYKEYITAENDRKAEQALKAQTSAIPTIVGATAEPNVNGAQQLDIDINAKPNLDATDPRAQFGNTAGSEFMLNKSAIDRERERQEALVKQERERIDKIRTDKEKAILQQQAAERAKQLADQEQKAYQDSMQRIAQQMKQYAGKAYDDWSKIPKQQYVQGKLASKEYKPKYPDAITPAGDALSIYGNRANGTESADGTVKPPVKRVNPRKVIKAGTVLFGIIETAINTDEPGPVLATVVSGRFNGARLLGSLRHQDQQTAVTISFNQMSIPKKLNSVSVSAVAVDPDTARTALASDVNRHILLRYGTLFASAFIAGYGQAIQQQGSVTTVSPLTGATTTAYPPLDNKQIFLAALGQVGTQWANATRSYFNTPYTVTVDQGTSVGLLFLTDADLTEDAY